MSEFLGLLVDRDLDGNIHPEWEEDHQLSINSFEVPPVSFCAGALDDIPDEWESPVKVFNQGSTSSCAGHAEAACFTHQNWAEVAGKDAADASEMLVFSPWFCYLTAQKSGNFFGRDQGTSIGSTIKAASSYGACLESLCKRPDRYNTTISDAALADAKKNLHLGSPSKDLRNWDDCIAWLTDKRSVVIGTKWYSSQSTVKNVETLGLGRGGSFRGYHARALIGHKKLNGEHSPRVLNSHGSGWGANGRATIERDLWEWWKQDSNFFALGFGDINERLPKRRDWSKFAWTGAGTTGSLV